jgi:hypothetical protein
MDVLAAAACRSAKRDTLNALERDEGLSGVSRRPQMTTEGGYAAFGVARI